MTKPALALAPMLALALVAPQPARACAPVWRASSDRVAVAAESAIIVWDAARKEERFIRRARFEPGNAADFGFLVPTPTKPELSEAEDAVFPAIDAFVESQRELVVTNHYAPGCFALNSRGGTREDTASAVTVLEEKTVAGLDASVLEADDAGALAAWLTAHGYAQRAEIVQWLSPYVAQHFKITAFKYAKAEPGAPSVFSRSVMLTFATPRPFYPYREPPDALDTPGRTLGVYLFSAERMEATLGEGTAPWSATTRFAGPASSATWLMARLPPMPPSPWLTVMIDNSTKRAAEDVFFAAAKDRSERRPPPIAQERRVEIPMEVVVLATFVAIILVWVRGRAR